MTKINQERIDKYHSGRMEEKEIADFENQLQSDPALKAESDFQADIVNGLKEFRKTELKSRMDAINVGPSWFEYAQQSALMKSMGGVIVASIIGTGIYFLGEKEGAVEESNPITIDAPLNESTEFVLKLGDENVPENERDLEKPIIEERESIAELQSESSNATAVIAENDETGKEESVKTDSFKPTFEAPPALTVEDDSKFTSSELDELPENSSKIAKEDPIDVRTENSRNTTIKYKYFDGKLFLSGDFDKAPYEILEINSADGRRIYVYYLGTYYKVGLTDKLIELPKVKDEAVIEELKLLRDNK
ncbi:hypothetical protein [Ekhidna sp.]|uniref:hypothetical protein n=1 Tax=Ekhidna sp. TaxID=2608089 RepID=UPI0032ED73C2